MSGERVGCEEKRKEEKREKKVSGVVSCEKRGEVEFMSGTRIKIPTLLCVVKFGYGLFIM
jgi:hypothetical protein